MQSLLDRAQRATDAQAAELYLQAAWASLDVRDSRTAQLAFDALEPGLLPQQLLSDYTLLLSEILLLRDDVTSAQDTFDQVPLKLRNTPRGQRAESRLCAATGSFVCAANSLIQGAAIDDGEVGADDGEVGADDGGVNELIWTYMGRASAFAASGEVERAQPGSTRQGWWSLKQQMLVSRTADEQRARLAAWQSDWESHPASRLPPASLLALQAQTWQPEHIGLLLPLSGSFARAGQALRDGFISAYLEQQSTRTLRITFYDTQSQPLPVVYERMLSGGVDLIIGPLQKNLVADFNALLPSVATLSLNYLDDNTIPAPNLLQLGLAIEDEARSINDRLTEDGATRILVFHNYEDWSLRARRQLDAQWQSPVTMQAFTDIRTITEAVGEAMGVASSQERRKELEGAIREELEFLPRARRDYDAIVALVGNVEANAMVPALKFHFADDLPVYASSQSVRGARSGQLDELNGIHVSDLPWLLFEPALHQEMLGPFNLDANPFSSLFALGADAFTVSSRLGTTRRDATTEVLGYTGALSLHPNGQFHRELTWGLIRDGRVQADR